MSNRWKAGFIQAFFDPLTVGPLLPFGPLYMWGTDENGQLGINSQGVAYSSPVQVGAEANWKVLELGGNSNYVSTSAIKTDGTLWSWGRNQAGQLGTGNIIARSSPVQVGALTNWSKLARGRTSCLAIKTDGTLWAWGDNTAGCLGLSLDPSGNAKSSPTQVGSLTTWLTISLAYSHVAAIKTDGTLWTWGGNGGGKLGHNDTVYRSSPVQVGSLTTWADARVGQIGCAAVRTDGTAWSWGADFYGQLALNIPQYSYRSSPVQIGALTNWSKATTTNTCFTAIKTDGTLWTSGYGAQGQTGQNNTTNVSSPVQVGVGTDWSEFSSKAQNTLLLKTDDTLWGLGLGNGGLHGNNSTANVSSPVQIGTSSWESISTSLSRSSGGIESS